MFAQHKTPPHSPGLATSTWGNPRLSLPQKADYVKLGTSASKLRPEDRQVARAARPWTSSSPAIPGSSAARKADVLFDLSGARIETKSLTARTELLRPGAGLLLRVGPCHRLPTGTTRYRCHNGKHSEYEPTAKLPHDSIPLQTGNVAPVDLQN